MEQHQEIYSRIISFPTTDIKSDFTLNTILWQIFNNNKVRFLYSQEFSNPYILLLLGDTGCELDIKLIETSRKSLVFFDFEVKI